MDQRNDKEFRGSEEQSDKGFREADAQDHKGFRNAEELNDKAFKGADAQNDKEFKDADERADERNDRDLKSEVRSQALLQKKEAALAQKEEQLARRENFLAARELLDEKRLPKEALALIDLESPETMRHSIEAVEALRRAFQPAQQAPRTGDSGSRTPGTYAQRAAQYLIDHGY